MVYTCPKGVTGMIMFIVRSIGTFTVILQHSPMSEEVLGNIQAGKETVVMIAREWFGE